MEISPGKLIRIFPRDNPRSLLYAALNWLVPALCLSCQRQIEADGSPFCEQCYTQLPFQQDCCRRCGQLLVADMDHCGRCLQHPPAFDLCFCPFRYQDPIADHLRKFKYQGKPEQARPLAQLLATEILATQLTIPELLIPVPLHPAKLRQRGFNQSWQLTRHLSRRLGIPCCNSLIVKTRVTPPQAQQKWQQRLTNVRGSFKLSRRPNVRHIAIVDDVVTTGSTAAEISKILKKYGVDYVQVWAVAHTV
ncbi:MAG: ComF family protein [Arenicella sp.]|nr:ComF family protein [Arenicella sp.]